MPTYRVLIEGTPLSGFDASEVVAKLAALTKQSEDSAARLLCGQPTVVKKNVDQATSLRYQQAFQAIGASSRIEAEMSEAPPDEPDLALRATEAVEEKGFCTHCGEQIGWSASFCGRCGARQTKRPSPTG